MLDDTTNVLIDPRIASAVIGATVVAFGWFISATMERRRIRALRLERVNDYQRALYAEIDAYFQALHYRIDLAAYRDAMIARMQDDPSFVPLIPTENNDLIFRSLLPDIHVLSRSIIDIVVLYYSQLAAISALIHDMRAPTFATLEVERRMVIYEDYIAMKQEAVDLAREALTRIEFSESHGEDALRTELVKRGGHLTASEQRLNSPGVGLSDQKSV